MNDIPDYIQKDMVDVPSPSLGGEAELPQSTKSVRDPVAMQPGTKPTVDRIYAGMLHMEKIQGELEALVDTIGATVWTLSIEDLCKSTLAIGRLLDVIENLRRTFNRNITPTKVALAKKIVGLDTDEVQAYGYKFRVEAKGRYQPPPVTRDLDAHNRLMRWLYKEATGADIEFIPPTWRVNQSELQAICEAKLAAGEALPPDVVEHNDITVRTSQIKSKD